MIAAAGHRRRTMADRDLRFCQDRAHADSFHVTHEFLAYMLGVRREGVTEAAGRLQNAGVIKYTRGHITVLDRPKLESLCCECYAVVKKEYDRLLPPILPA
mgnify:CR=1 FL=1